jgi:cytochrome c
MKFITVFGLLFSLTSYAADSSSCETCHGPKGKAPVEGEIPKLAGQSKAYLVKQLEDFKSGARKGAMMNPLSANLTSKQITELAEYFSNNSCK